MRNELQINRQVKHGAFALNDSGDMVIFLDRLPLENLDRNELDSTIEATSAMLAEWTGELMSFHQR